MDLQAPCLEATCAGKAPPRTEVSNRFTDSIHTGGHRFTLIPVNVGVIF